MEVRWLWPTSVRGEQELSRAVHHAIYVTVTSVTSRYGGRWFEEEVVLRARVNPLDQEMDIYSLAHHLCTM